SKLDACITASKPLKLKPKMRQSLHSFRLQSVHIYLTTDTPSPPKQTKIPNRSSKELPNIDMNISP
ncbi:MAG: hypothetical protein M3O03_05605, partial [Pseudomonadota bacterium]|nr:hypothetical protein [Pseudomonadota bacterium]